MKKILLFCLLFCTTLSMAQSILNGSFENNTFSGQYCSGDDFNYNEKMENSSLIESTDAMGVFNQGCQFLFSDGIFELAQPDGIWCIHLLAVDYHYTFLDTNVVLKRGITLKLSEPLNPNHWYRLSYYIKDFPLLSPNDGAYETFVDSTGELTHPVMQTTSLEIGISDSESAFGSSIDTSIVPPQYSYQESMQEEWIAQEVVFSPSFAAEHITCRPILPDTCQTTSRYSLFADHFVLEVLTSIDRLQNQLTLYPNPVKDRLYIKGEENIIIEVHDLLGGLHHTEQLTKPFINIAHLAKGIYIIKVKQSNGQYIHLQNIIKS